jgi:hypothetical protein
MTQSRKPRRGSAQKATTGDEVIRFVVLETATQDEFTLDVAKAGDDEQFIYSTDEDSPLDVLNDCLELTPSATLNPHMAYSTRAPWYLEALNPKYKGKGMGERKFKHGFAIAKILNWCEEDGNDLDWGKYIGGKPQMKDPKSLGKKQSKGRQLVKRSR